MQTHRLLAAVGRGDNPDQAFLVRDIFAGAVEFFEAGIKPEPVSRLYENLEFRGA